MHSNVSQVGMVRTVEAAAAAHVNAVRAQSALEGALIVIELSVDAWCAVLARFCFYRLQ